MSSAHWARFFAASGDHLPYRFGKSGEQLITGRRMLEIIYHRNAHPSDFASTFSPSSAAPPTVSSASSDSIISLQDKTSPLLLSDLPKKSAWNHHLQYTTPMVLLHPSSSNCQFRGSVRKSSMKSTSENTIAFQTSLYRRCWTRIMVAYKKLNFKLNNSQIMCAAYSCTNIWFFPLVWLLKANVCVSQLSRIVPNIVLSKERYDRHTESE